MKVVNIHNAQTHRDVVALLEAVLEQARGGWLTGITVISRHRDGDVVLLSDSWENRDEAIGTLYRALNDMTTRAE